MKKDAVRPLDIYLGNKVSQVMLEIGVKAWSFSSAQYTQAAVKNVERFPHKRKESLPKKPSAPFTSNHRPEIDISAELSPANAAHYQSLIGILRWIVELGRINITVEVSMMSSMLALPCRGHLDQLFHIFAYLKQRYNTEMVFDSTVPDFDEDSFPKEDWTYTPYTQGKEEIPSNVPTARGLGFKVNVNVDSDHASDWTTRRSRTGFIIFLELIRAVKCSYIFIDRYL